MKRFTHAFLALIALFWVLGPAISAVTSIPCDQLPAITGDVTRSAGSCASTLAAGSASNLNSGTLPAGRLPALTGDVTSSAGSAATTLAAGNAGNLNSGTLLAARMPALTGDCTTSAGAVATTCTKINAVDQTTAWTSYTPSIGCGSGTMTTASATGRSKTLGKTIFFSATVTITTNGTCAGNLQIGIPVTAGSGTYLVVGNESAVTGKQVAGSITSGASVALTRFYDGTYPGANSNVINIGGVYESN